MAILSTSVYDLVSGRYGGLPLRSTMSTQRIKSFGHHGGSVSGDPYTGLLPKCKEDVNVSLENRSISKKFVIKLITALLISKQPCKSCSRLHTIDFAKRPWKSWWSFQVKFGVVEFGRLNISLIINIDNWFRNVVSSICS